MSANSPASANHYFTQSPDVKYKQYNIEYSLRGKTYSAIGASGVFSPKKLDLGTRVLLEYILKNVNLEGKAVLDFGSGWGPISLMVANEFPTASLSFSEINERARELTDANLKSLGAKGIPRFANPSDVILSNPPIKSGKEALHSITYKCLELLNIGGVIYFVIQKHLGADSFINWFNENISDYKAKKVASSKGYRIIMIN